MADIDKRTLMMLGGDFITETDEDGTVREVLIEGLEAFGQRIANRLLAVRGESPFDPTIGLPLQDLAELQNEALFMSFAAEAVANDSEVRNIQAVEFLPPTDEEYENGERTVQVSVVSNDGELANVLTRLPA